MTGILTLEQAAERCACHPKTLRRAITAGELRASEIARGKWIVQDADLVAFLDVRANRPRHLPPPANPVEPPTVHPRRRRRGSEHGRLVLDDDMGRAA